MGRSATFSYDVRLLLCPNCSAPISFAPRGGTATCGYCGYTSHLASREEAPLAPPRRNPIAEAERLRRLRLQDRSPMAVPGVLQPLMEGASCPGAIAEWKVDEAVRLCNQLRQQLASGHASTQTEEVLYALTLLLATHYSAEADPTRERAFHESAMETLTLPRHKQVLRGILARSAAREGDLDAAERWLAPCDPLSDDLQSDSAYRLTRAAIDTARGDFGAVIQVLHPDEDSLPFADEMELVVDVLRINAFEKLGDQQSARRLLERLRRRLGGAANQLIGRVVALHKSWDLCHQTLAAAGVVPLVPGAGFGAGGSAAAKQHGGDEGKDARWAIYLGLAYGCSVALALALILTYTLMAVGTSWSSLAVLFVFVGLLALTSMGLTFLAILRATEAAAVHVLFDTWFPLFMVLVPVGGPFIALWSAQKLIRGKLGAATITVSGGGRKSRTNYGPVKLGRTAIPGGVVLILLATMQPSFALIGWVGAGKGAKGSGSGASVAVGLMKRAFSGGRQDWDGKSRLSCGSGQIYRLVNKTVERRNVHLRGDCQLTLKGCTAKTSFHVSAGARLILDGSRLVGRSPIYLRGGELSIKGGEIQATDTGVAIYGGKATLTNVQIVAKRMGIRVSNSGTLSMTGGMVQVSRRHATGVRFDGTSKGTLTKVTVGGGRLGLYLSRSAEVTLLGATVGGKYGAAKVYGGAALMHRDCTFSGKLRTSSGGSVVALKAEGDVRKLLEQRRAMAKVRQRYKRHACDGMLDCYSSTNFGGQVSARIETSVDDKGKVTRVRVRHSRAPAKLKRCLKSAGKAIVIENFAGPAGTLRCSYSGTIMGGTQMLSRSSDFVPARAK